MTSTYCGTMEGEKGTVCVTGGAGHIASWLIMRLLKHGYSVRATVRSDPKFKEDPSHILNLPEAQEKLQIFDAELEKPESFDAVIDGCVGVFHLSHPLDLEGKMSTEEILKTSVEGSIGILKACLKSKTVKRVVYTSSIAAALDVNLAEIDERTWTDVDFFRQLDVGTIPYIVSKTMTEKAVIEFSKEHGLDLVTILPSVIVGPFLSSAMPRSFPLTLPFLFGNEALCKNMKIQNLVHIDDVAAAQIFLFESAEAEGRHICSAADVTMHEMASLLSLKCPEKMIPTDFLSEMDNEKPTHLSSKKLTDLGFKFEYGVEEMIDGLLQCCKDKGFL